MTTVTLGLEQFCKASPSSFSGLRFGLLCNQASVDSTLHHSRDIIRDCFPGQLTCLLSPQHGFFAEKQDNMIESGHTLDPASGLPLFSLYAESRKPSMEMYDLFDVLLIDVFDVGTRVYTFLYTMAYCLQAAAAWNKKVVVLDRPNPVGGIAVEGNILRDDCRSFVGLYPLPMRHGLTFGELALLINSEFGIGADLDIVSMQGWRRSMLFRDTGLPWVFPSPNMPTPETALVYPGQVIWEGTNISEGRGTTLPFELFGAPFFETEKILEYVAKTQLPGCLLRPVFFEPTSNKWAGEPCAGFHLHVTDPETFMPYRTSIALLQAVMRLYPEKFRFKQPPYEYEYERLPLDLILGDKALREALAEGISVFDLEARWRSELDDFDTMRHKYFLYS